MRIIKITRGTVEAERQLVTAMLNLEHGARVFDDDGKELPAPHESFPVVKVPPRTEKGLPVTFTYKPSVGVVFYSAARSLNLPALLGRLKTALEAHGNGHLQAYRSTSAGPCITVRQKNSGTRGTHIVGPQAPFRKRDDDAPPSARMLLYTSPSHTELPSHISYRAVFTWVFMSGAAAVNLECKSMAHFNASVASIFYDTASVIINPEPTYSLKPENLTIPIPSPELRELGKLRKGNEALLIDQGGAITAVGNASSLLCESICRAPGGPRYGPHPQTQEVKWGSLRLTNAELNDYSCPFCGIPLWGQTYILFDPREPSNPRDIDGFFITMELRSKQRILGNRGIAICRHCIYSIPHCAQEHLQCKYYSSISPRSQEEALAGSALGYLLPIIKAGTASPLQHWPGMFLVNNKDGKTMFILASSGVLPYIEMAYSDLLALGVPIVRYPQIVADRNDQE